MTVAYLLVGSFWFQHWYLLWALAPAALLPDSRFTRTQLPVYCLGALWSDLTTSFLLYLPARPLTATQVSAISVMTQVLPLLSVLAFSLLWRRGRPLVAAGWPSEAVARREAAIAPAPYEMDGRP